MRILIVHNYYQQPGGEDQVFTYEANLLKSQGHDVATFTMHNDQVRGMGRLKLAAATVWNGDAHQAIGQACDQHHPQVVHFHNTFPLISPAGYAAARDHGAAVVQTLHNFRLLCISPYLFRNGKVCQDCVGKTVGWRGVVHGCYRGSRCGSAVAALASATHKLRGTWQDAVDLFVTPSEFARKKFLSAHLPMQRIVVKPNFVFPDPGPGDHSGQYAVFVGRLSPEKGVHTLLTAWSRLGGKIPLKIVGDGPMAEEVRQAQQRGQVQWLGHKSADQVGQIVGQAALLVAPSECYETFGRVAVEAFAKCTPVVASRLGALEEVVDHGRTGLLFQPGDADDLCAKVRLMMSDAVLRQHMGRAARMEFEGKYTGAINARQLEAIYQQAIAAAQQRYRAGLVQLGLPQVAR